MTERSTSLAGMSALVTGGGSGIGLAAASALARDGMHVTIMGRSPDRLAAGAEALAAVAADGVEVRTFAGDVSSEDDVAALGDNVVTILNAVKEMTQPEVMGLVQRTAISVQDVEEAHIEPPSMFALLKQMRDPQTRRGLARVMAMLHTVGEEHPSTPTTEGK